MKDLEDATIAVTGACGILGRVISRYLLDLGASVIMIDVEEADPVRVAGEVGQGGTGRASGCVVDLADHRSLRSRSERIVDEFGAPRGLVNGAATKGGDLSRFLDPVETYRPSTWREVMQVNIDGLFFFTQAIGQSMVAHGQGGSIVNIASVYGHLGPDQRIYEGSEYLGSTLSSPAVYSASKGAVIALTRHLATWWAKDGLRVNAVSPGGVFSGQNDAFVEAYSARVPLGRMAKATEIASVVAFLLSDSSSYIVGQNICVDGGLSCW